MLLLSIIWISHEKKLIRLTLTDYPKVSILIPAFNEENIIVEIVTHLINLDYPEIEIIIINDGSDDQTLSLLVRSFEMSEITNFNIIESIATQHINRGYKTQHFPNLIVIDKVNGGKADALNCGINASSSEYIIALDADTRLTPNTIRYLVKPAVQNPNVLVTSGSVRIISEKSHSFLSDLQQIEFVNSISLFRTGWNYLNANLIISGALGLFSRNLLIKVKGYHNFAIGEDMELIVRIHRTLIENNVQYKLLQFSLPTCFTSAVPSLKELITQRKRWQKGLLSSLRLNTKLFFNPHYNAVGLIAIPYYLLFEIISPFIELIGMILIAYMMTVHNSITPIKSFLWITPFWFWLSSFIFAVVNDIISLSIDKFLLRGMSLAEYFRLIFSLVISSCFYHFIQLYCKIKGTIEYFSSIQTSTKWDTSRK
jgi:poly-beta-1,6-N-acetyl-D-glucosamine synthase